jgi:hypothetical protein
MRAQQATQRTCSWADLTVQLEDHAVSVTSPN